MDNLLQLRPLFAERLRALRIVPDVGLLELAAYFLEPCVFLVIVKDTPSGLRNAPEGPRLVALKRWFRSLPTLMLVVHFPVAESDASYYPRHAAGNRRTLNALLSKHAASACRKPVPLL